jgi:hypothetical protein
MSDEATTSACWICDKIAPPPERIIDALGYPVHRNCYAEMLREEESRRKSGLQSEKPSPANIWRKLRTNAFRSSKP